jgi:protein gp37
LTKLVGGERRWTGKVNFVESALDQPLRWSKPRKIFVNSMSDLFHESVPDEWIDRIFAVMALASQHTFQILTKRPERMRDYCASLSFRDMAAHTPPGSLYHQSLAGMERAFGLAQKFSYDPPTPPLPLPNVWLGVSVENQATADERIPLLLQTPAAKRFISAEPLLGPLDLSDLTIRVRPGEQPCGLAGLDALTGIHWDAEDTIVGLYGNPDPRIDWVIVGGESGTHARPMHPDWARSLRDQCKDAGVAFFWKQWGEWCPPWDGLKYDTSKGRAGSPPAFLVAKNGTVHCFKNDATDQAAVMVRVGKREAGDLLDNVQHHEFPA